MNAGAQRVERKLAHRNSHSADAEIAESKYSLAICYDDNLDVPWRRIVEQRGDFISVGIRDVESAWSAEHVTVALATEADGRGVDDRHHLRDVFENQTIEKWLVAVLQCGE